MVNLITGSENLFKKLLNLCALTTKNLKHIFMGEISSRWLITVKMLKYQNRKLSFSWKKLNQSFILLKEWWNKDLNSSVRKFSTITFQKKDILKKSNRKTYQLSTFVRHLSLPFIQTLTLQFNKIKLILKMVPQPRE